MKRSNLKNVIAVIAAVLAVLFAFVACTVKEKTPGGDENAGENGGQVTPETIYLDSVTPGGSYLEYGKLSVNADADGTRSLKLEITDNSGQGGVGWGECLLYR